MYVIECGTYWPCDLEGHWQTYMPYFRLTTDLKIWPPLAVNYLTLWVWKVVCTGVISWNDSNQAQTYLQPHFDNDVFGYIYLLAGQH